MPVKLSQRATPTFAVSLYHFLPGHRVTGVTGVYSPDRHLLDKEKQDGCQMSDNFYNNWQKCDVVDIVVVHCSHHWGPGGAHVILRTKYIGNI